MLWYRNYMYANPFDHLFSGFLGFMLFPLVLWSLFWKGMALWKAAKNEDKVWFIVLLVVNTLGILEILYIYVFSKKKGKRGRK